MKNCEEVRELLSFYLDNELHENERKQVVKHLEGCDSCKAELDQLKGMIDIIGEIEEVDLPADLGQKLHDKLVEAHEKSNFAAWTGKKNIFKWASAMVAGFVLLFAVVNSSLFDQLLQFSNNSKTAYVNDTHLNIVGKQAMENSVQKQEVAEENTQQKITASKNEEPTVHNKTSINKSKGTVSTSSNVSKSVEQNKINPAPQDNAVAPSDTASLADEDKKVSSIILPPKTSSMTISVDDVSEAAAEVNNIVKENGGSAQKPQTFGIMTANSVNETKNLTLQIPAAAYSRVMDSIGKIGAVQTQIGSVQEQPQVQSSSAQVQSGAQLKLASPQAASSTAETDIITVIVTIQKK